MNLPHSTEQIRDIESLATIVDNATVLGNPSIRQFARKVSFEASHHLAPAAQSSPMVNQLARLVSSINYLRQPCLVLGVNGKIIGGNGPANTILDFSSADHVDDLAFSCLDGDLIQNKILSINRDRIKFFSFRVRLHGQEKPFSLIMSNIENIENITIGTIIYFLTLSEIDKIIKLFIEGKNITSSEEEILQEFIYGSHIKEIPKLKGVSISTVRTQFYSALNKIGVTSQSELLREFHSFSSFVSVTSEILKTSEHPYRKSANVLRSGGRLVELTMAGDFQGRPVFVLNSPTLNTFSPVVEALFKERGILSVSVSRPGFGSSSSEPTGVDYYDCVAADVSAILDQLDEKDCVLFGTSGGIRCSIEVANRIPDRIHHVIGYNITFPSSYLNGVKAASNFLTQLELKLAGAKYIRREFIRTVARITARSSTKRVLKLAFRHSPETLREVLEPPIFEEIDSALKAVFAQGIDPIVDDYERNSADWFELLWRTETPITCINAATMHFSSSKAVKKFQEDFSKRVHFVHYGGPALSLEHSAPEFLSDLFLDCSSERTSRS